MYSRKKVSEIVKKLINNFNEDAWYINNGWCWGFANKLAKLLGPDAKVVDSTHNFKKGTFPGHSWVLYNGFHYDAESPNGEMYPSQMQYHKRMRAIADAPDTADTDQVVRDALGHDPIYYGSKSKH